MATSSTFLQPSLSLSLSLSHFLINFQLIVIFFQTFPPPYFLFISPLLTILVSLFLYSFIFLYFWLFLFPSSSYKFQILSSILCIVFPYTKCYFISLSLIFYFSFFGGFFIFHASLF